ncbi:MAG: hypothetical protein PHE81_05335 [Atribacterota bacterium]|nr:hypothetical protein [Atribacterota bacterium]
MAEERKGNDKKFDLNEKQIVSALMDYCTDSIYFNNLQTLL